MPVNQNRAVHLPQVRKRPRHDMKRSHRAAVAYYPNDPSLWSDYHRGRQAPRNTAIRLIAVRAELQRATEMHPPTYRSILPIYTSLGEVITHIQGLKPAKRGTEAYRQPVQSLPPPPPMPTSYPATLSNTRSRHGTEVALPTYGPHGAAYALQRALIELNWAGDHTLDFDPTLLRPIRTAHIILSEVLRACAPRHWTAFPQWTVTPIDPRAVDRTALIPPPNPPTPIEQRLAQRRAWHRGAE